MQFTKAKREKVPLKISLIGPSGSGKSYSALRMAKGMLKGTDKQIYYIDTEGGRGKYYADDFDYNYVQLEPPFTPERYRALIDEVIKQSDVGVLIIDSISHEWAGSGGLLEAHSNIPGNSYAAWKTITPRHTKFLESILLAPIHIITTARAKEEYILDDSSGKMVPKKVGMGAITRDGYNYEMTVSFVIDQKNHFATIDKDNTHLFDNFCELIEEKHGEKLVEWANSAAEVAAGAHSHINRAVEPKKAPEKDEVKVDTPKKETKKTEKAQVADEVLPKDEEVYFDDFTYIKDAEEKFKLTTDKANQKKYFEIMKGQGLTMDQIKAIVKGEDIQKAGVTAEQLREIRAGIILDFEAALDNSSVVESIMLD